jgi:exosome complex component RRP41
MTPEEYKKCVEVGIKGCKIVYDLQKKALHSKYFDGDRK